MSDGNTVWQAIGNTALVKLCNVVPADSGNVFVKMELQNPTGRMKDRMALGLFSRAESDGRIRAGTTIVEYTGGTTGASLAFVCAAKGHKIHVVSSKAFS